MARKTLRRLLEKSLGSEWDQLLRKIRRRDARRFLIFWNRGLGDVALGLCRVVEELRVCVAQAEITVVTRGELAEAVGLLAVDRVLVDRSLQRTEKVDVSTVLARIGESAAAFDLVLGRPDPTHWFRGRPARPPRLRWPTRGDALCERFSGLLDDADEATVHVAVHVSSETANLYSYRKDWPHEHWRALFARVGRDRPVRFVLFGHAPDACFADLDCIDLRGHTSFLEMMSLIRNRCPVLIAPDSGVLTMTYYLDGHRPIEIVSLWADPRQGIIKQAVPSPNPLLRHQALLGADERIENIRVDEVAGALDRILDRLQVRDGQALETA